jgi:hypothetical protein
MIAVEDESLVLSFYNVVDYYLAVHFIIDIEQPAQYLWKKRARKLGQILPHVYLHESKLVADNGDLACLIGISEHQQV